ncbi:MAG: ATP-binding protein [Gammaproteobacteria bacterium]|nr:ATP-binding protein [Gammaproteobacteria bacterium]
MSDTIPAIETNKSIQMDYVKVERIRFLYRGAMTAVNVNIGILILTLWLLWGQVEHDNLLIWAAAILVVTAFRAVSAYNFKHKSADIDDIKTWYWLFLCLSTTAGFTWGISIWIFSPYENIVTPVLLVFVLGGLTAGAAAVLGAVLTVYFSYVLAIMLPAAIWFFLQPIQNYFIMAIMLFVYIFTMMIAGYLYRKILIHSITLSKDLIEEKNRAEVANRAKTEFLSSMSHEFRTPLNAIIGFAQLLEMDAESPLNKHQRESVDFIENSGKHLLSLVDEVIDLAKIEAGKINITLQNVLLSSIVEECLPIVQTLAFKQQIKINIDDQAIKQYVLRADHIKLKQVIINLLNNAIKYNYQGGSVGVSCRKIKENYLRIEISDSGKGIPEEKKKLLFLPFERLGYEKSNIQGTGLGLILTKRIIDAMDGRVGYASKQGNGSLFWVELPLVTE